MFLGSLSITVFLYGERVPISECATIHFVAAQSLPANCGLVSLGEPMRYVIDKLTISGSPGVGSSDAVLACACGSASTLAPAET